MRSNNKGQAIQDRGGHVAKYLLTEREFRVKPLPGNPPVNIKVTGYTTRGERTHMEDEVSVSFVPVETGNQYDISWAYFGVFDGHGGVEASRYAKKHLMEHITTQPGFKSEDDSLVLKSIKQGFLKLQENMLRDRADWPRTKTGYLSTAGTTASIAFIRNGKLYTGHVGDSRIVLGMKMQDVPDTPWQAVDLTEDHKPGNEKEEKRINACGGKVIVRAGVPRVVWRRSFPNQTGPFRRSTLVEEIPFLAVARSLGDLWSYNPVSNKYVVSPEPDVNVIKLDPTVHRCLLLASDGIWDVVTSQEAVTCVEQTESERKQLEIRKSLLDINSSRDTNQNVSSTTNNPSTVLVNLALEGWRRRMARSDNTSVLTILIEPPDSVPSTNLYAGDTLGRADEPVGSDEVSSSDGESGEYDVPYNSPTPSIGFKSNDRQKKMLTVQSQVVSSSVDSVSKGLRINRSQSDVCRKISPKHLKRKRKSSKVVLPSSTAKSRETDFEIPPEVMKIGDKNSKTTSTKNSKRASKRHFRCSISHPSPDKLRQVTATSVRVADPESHSTGVFSGASTKRIDNLIIPILPPESLRQHDNCPNLAQRKFHKKNLSQKTNRQGSTLLRRSAPSLTSDLGFLLPTVILSRDVSNKQELQPQNEEAINPKRKRMGLRSSGAINLLSSIDVGLSKSMSKKRLFESTPKDQQYLKMTLGCKKRKIDPPSLKRTFANCASKKSSSKLSKSSVKEQQNFRRTLGAKREIDPPSVSRRVTRSVSKKGLTISSKKSSVKKQQDFKRTLDSKRRKADSPSVNRRVIRSASKNTIRTLGSKRWKADSPSPKRRVTRSASKNTISTLGSKRWKADSPSPKHRGTWSASKKTMSESPKSLAKCQNDFKRTLDSKRCKADSPSAKRRVTRSASKKPVPKLSKSSSKKQNYLTRTLGSTKAKIDFNRRVTRSTCNKQKSASPAPVKYKKNLKRRLR